VLGSWDELIDNVGPRAGMFVGRARYALVRSFVEGFGAAKDDDVLHGFQQWLSSQPQHRAIRNFACCMRCSPSVTEWSNCHGRKTRPQPIPAGPCRHHPQSARTTSPTPKTTGKRSLTCSHGCARTWIPGQPLVTASRRQPDQPRSSGHRHDRGVTAAGSHAPRSSRTPGFSRTPGLGRLREHIGEKFAILASTEIVNFRRARLAGVEPALRPVRSRVPYPLGTGAWSSRTESNGRPLACRASALPTALRDADLAMLNCA
jgi:hypothetical protein